MKQQKFTNEYLTNKQKIVKDFILGSASYFFALVFTTPFQRYQMLMIQQQKKMYNSHFNTLWQLCKDSPEGLTNLWRGHPDDFRYILSHGLLFSIYEIIRRATFNYYSKNNITINQSYKSFLSGTISGGIHLFLIYPFIQTRLKLKQLEYRKILLYENHFIAQMYKIVQVQGIKVLYSGFHLSVISASLYRGIYFGGYEITHKLLSTIPYLDNIITNLIIAYIFTTVAEVISYPFERFYKKKSGQTFSYLSELTEINSKYRNVRSTVTIVAYWELQQIYDQIMKPFILDLQY